LRAGITGGYGGDRCVEYIIPPAARKKGEHKFVIESSCNGMFGMGGGGIGPPDVSAGVLSLLSQLHSFFVFMF
jgi:alpha-mannosidase